MRRIAVLHDPGIGREGAEPGTVDWARRVRLELQGLVNDIPKAPESVKQYIDGIVRHRAWTLLNKPDGALFATFEEFCAFRQPWGLGRPWDGLRRVLEVALGERGLALAAVNPDRRAARARLPNGTFPPSDNQSPPGEGIGSGHARHERLRAVLRAPEAVQELYRGGLIGLKVAARLGPKNPTQERAAFMAEVAREVATLAKTHPQSNAETQRRVNARVSERLGTPERERRRAQVRRLLDQLDDDDLHWLYSLLVTNLKSIRNTPRKTTHDNP